MDLSHEALDVAGGHDLLLDLGPQPGSYAVLDLNVAGCRGVRVLGVPKDDAVRAVDEVHHRGGERLADPASVGVDNDEIGEDVADRVEGLLAPALDVDADRGGVDPAGLVKEQSKRAADFR